MRSKPSLWLTAVALMSLSVAAPVWSAPVTVGDDIRVNTNSESKQRNPVAAFHSSGRYLVVWENDKNGLRGRFFDRDGSPLSAEMGLVANQVLTSVPSEGDVTVRKDPALALLPSGEFLLFWTEEKAHLRTDFFAETRTVLDRDVYGQRFGTDGRAVGAAFRVNAASAGDQARPKTVVLQGGRVAVTWESAGLYARVVSRTGQLLGEEIKVNAQGGRKVQNAALAANNQGEVLITWESCCGDGSGQGIAARLFDRDFSPVGSDFRINTETAGEQRRPAVTADGSDFLVVWQGQFGPVTHSRIFGQFIGRAGNRVGSQFRVSEGNGVGEAHISPSVVATSGGRFLVAWMDWKSIFPLGIFGVEIDGVGAVATAEVKLSGNPLTAHYRTSLVAGPGSEILLPYEGYVGDNRGISARRLAAQ
jgi:hypothetical protein